MIIHIDVDAFYEWKPAPDAKPTEDEILGMLYKASGDGRWLKREIVDEETHTTINIPEVMVLDAQAQFGVLGKPFNRGMFIAKLVQEDIMKHHAPQHGFVKVTVDGDPQLEGVLNALLIPEKKPSGAGSAGGGTSSRMRARPYQRRGGRNFGEEKEGTHSHFHTEVRGADGRLKYRGPLRHNLTTDTASGYTNRRDWQAKAMGGGLGAFFGATATGFATSVTATSLTNTGAAFPTANQGLAGMIVAAGPNNAGAGSTVFGVIVSNTGTVLTIDQWYNPATGAAGTTPNGTCSYQVLPGQFPAMFIAVTSDATAPAATDTTLTSEATTNGFARALAAWAHTAAASTYTLTKTFTASGSLTVNKVAVFGACNTTGGGVMPFESAEPTPPALISGDTLAQTVTVTIN